MTDKNLIKIAIKAGLISKGGFTMRLEHLSIEDLVVAYGRALLKEVSKNQTRASSGVK